MSLLMEALRKAEEAKRRMQQEEQAAAASRDRAVAPAPAASPASGTPGSASSLTLEEREVSPQFIRENFTGAQNPQSVREHRAVADAAPDPAAQPDAPPVPQPAPEPASPALVRRQQRAAAASVFSAKQGPARNRRTLTILVIVMVLMIPVGGGVLWYLQSMPSSSIGINPNLATYDLSARQLSDAPVAPATPAATATGPAPDAAAGGATDAGNVATTAAVPPAVTPDSAAEAAPDPAAPPVPPVPAVAEADSAPDAAPVPSPELAAADTAPVPVPPPGVIPPGAAEPAPAPPAASSLTVMEISRSTRGSQVNPDLMAAYESFQGGDLATARRLYEQVLDVVPNNRDALLGLASINLRQSDAPAARERYARLLQLNPRDPLAHTGLLQTLQITDAAEHERTLKSLISEYQDVAQLTLALGNLYASQQRWSEAQGAYYNALLTASRSSGPVHPDYAFNLAVSLERLNEPKAALDFYRQAKALAAEVTPGFDPQLLNSRLAYLEQAQP